MTRLAVKFGMKPQQKRLLCGVESRVLLERHRNEDDESNKRPRKLDHIPLDLLEAEILTRLPVKSVIRSRCLSKMWSSIIRSQRFIASYYAMSSATRSRFIVVLSNSIFVNGDAKRLFIFSGEESSSSSSSVANLDMKIPSVCLDGYSKCSSVHGFVGCCYAYPQFTICNPITGQVVTLPCKGNPISWGYDPVDDQFKALTMVPTPDHGYDCITVLEVIRLGGGGGGGGGESRDEVSTPPHCPLTKGICINGFLYYGASAPRRRTNPVMVCFDVRYEKISFIRTPNDVLIMLSGSVLIEYKGKLACIVRHFPTNFRTFDLWILEDVKKHDWSKQTFKLPYNLVGMTSPGTNKAGEIIFAPTKLSHLVQPFYIFYYNLERKDMRKVRIHGIADDQAFRRRYGLVENCHVFISPGHTESIASL